MRGLNESPNLTALSTLPSQQGFAMHLVLSLRLHRGMTHRLHHHYCGVAMKPSRTASIYPTVDEINALPEKFRQYIHDALRQER